MNIIIFTAAEITSSLFLRKKGIGYVFFFCCCISNPPLSLANIGRHVSHFVQHRVFNTGDLVQNILDQRFVELVNFSLMPNHYHILLREIREGGISQFMQKVLNAYTKYFNTKSKISGHLFQGPFQAVHVQTNEQLLHLSAYIHRNPVEINSWKLEPQNFPWSSYQDFVGKNRWGNLLVRNVILDQFENLFEYHEFVKNSGTKMNEEYEEDLFIDINGK